LDFPLNKLRATEPFDLSLSLKAASSFSGTPLHPDPVLRIPARVNHEPIVIVVRQTTKHPPTFEVSSSSHPAQASEIASFVLNVDFDIRPFYKIALANKKLRQLVTTLQGLRPLRPASLFEMLVTAITEQQISLRLAYKIREKMAMRFGNTVAGQSVFPDANMLARASLSDLLNCELSHRKAEYIRDLSKMIVTKRLNLEKLKEMIDNDVYTTLTRIRGIGPWTAEYVLVRGLGRPDRVPIQDIGIRDVVGKYLANGKRVEPSEVLKWLNPFEPFRGLAAYYLLVYDRLYKA
jgi:DNA-3-methyladenine glycosylase II